MQALDEGMDRYRPVWTIWIHKQLLAVSNRTNVRNVGPVEASLSVEFPKPSLTFKARSQSAKLWSPTLGRGVPWQQNFKKCAHWESVKSPITVESAEERRCRVPVTSAVRRRLQCFKCPEGSGKLRMKNSWRTAVTSSWARDRALKCRSRKKNKT